MSATNTRKSSEGVSFVQVTHPEVLRVEPRPGGVVPIARHFAPHASSTPNAPQDTPLKEKTSREFRVQCAMDEVDSVTSEEATLPNPMKDAMYMISVVISTVMMLAAEFDPIPEEHREMAEVCLEGVKDDFGSHPPNVQGMINHLKMLKGNAKQEEEEA